MPLTYMIDENVGLITITLSGVVVASDITDYMAASRTDAAFRHTMHRLVVAEQVEGFPQLPEVQQLTKRTAAGSGAALPRIAAVANTPLGLGMIAMFFGHWGLSDHYRMFDDVPGALAWLTSEEKTS